MNASMTGMGSRTGIDSERDPLERLTDEFLQRHRRGEKPSVAEYAERFPDLAGQIREIFPALLILEQAGPQGTAGSFGLLGDPNSPQRTPPAIGDYRLIREIGRGAMGVVYEAQQQSLDRRVALKILPWHSSSDNQAAERFRREAKAAARLHHTNIVPVFEIGQAGEVCFYTMQFIQGQSLDKVIVELRRLERNRKLDLAGELPTERAPSLQGLALSLHDGQFAQEAQTEPITAQLASPETIQLAAGSTVNDNKSRVSLTDSGKEHYYRSVAQMGRQIADALAYAHSRGVIHRDIKPSNVLLDAAGVAWVTDFGLAKIEDAGLTQAGDILGTLRYMAPERFQGQCDATADVYSLGVTLYELLVLRPPHDGEQRAELIAQITQRDPLPLRVIDAGVPRDLEMIVLKALEREPQHRYPTAAAVAEDLRRFLADEPILGRRISPWERFARWVRHNRLLAASIIGSAVLLMLLVVATGLAGASFRALAIQEREERIDTTRHLYRSLRGEGTATRLARREGFRSQVWSLLDEARRLDSEVVNKEELRAEAIQSLGDFVGLKPQDLRDFPAEVRSLAISPDAKLIAVGLASGAIQWHEAATGNVVSKRSEHFAAVTRLAFTPEGVLLSSDARGVVRSWQRKQDDVWESAELTDALAPLLAIYAGSPEQRLIAHRADTATVVTIDDLSSRRRVTVDPGRIITAAAFNQEGTWLAAIGGDDIFVWQTAGGGLIKRANSNLGPLTGVTFSRDGQLVLCTGEQGLAVFDLPELHQQTFTRTEQLAAGAFSRDGRQVAIASEGRRVTLWSVFGNREVAALTHPGWKPLHTVAFSDDERLLASADGDSVRIWNLAGTPERLNLAGHTSGVTSIGFSPDGSKLYSTSKDRKISLWDVKTGERLAITGLSSTMQAADFSGDGKLLAAGDSAGKLSIFDAESLAPLIDVSHPLGGLSSVRFTGDGKYFAAAGPKGLMLWRVKVDPPGEDGKPRVSLEEAKRVEEADCGGLTISPDSQFLAWLNGQGRISVLVLDQLAQWPCNAQRALPGSHNLAFHGDSRHLLLVDTNNQLVQWDVLGDRNVAVIGERGDIRGTNLAVGPNGRWAVVNAEPLRLSVWDLVDRKQAFLFREERSAVSATAWSAAGNRLAFGTQDGQVAIWDLAAMRKELASIELDWPNDAFEMPKGAAAASPVQALTDALEREPKNAMLLLRRASLHLEKGDTDQALADLNKALEADEKNETALVTRSNLYARTGKWTEAAADALKAVEQNPEPVRNHVAAAILLARAGDARRYQEHCGKMVERFAETSDPQVAASVLRGALLLPDAVDTSRLPRQVVESAAAGFGPASISRADAYTSLALLELRSGKPEGALSFIRRAQSDPAYSKTPAIQSLSFLIQAVAEHAIGKRTVARESLKASRDFASGILPDAPRSDFVISNRARIVLETLLPEAERSIR